MGKDVFGMIEDFGGRGKIVEVHFRNVTGPPAPLHRDLPDDGYVDMYAVMKALRKVNFTGAVEPTTCRAWWATAACRARARPIASPT